MSGDQCSSHKQWRDSKPLLESPLTSIPPNTESPRVSALDDSLENVPSPGCAAGQWKPAKSLIIKSFLKRMGTSSDSKNSEPFVKTVRNNNSETLSPAAVDTTDVKEDQVVSASLDKEGCYDSSLVDALGSFRFVSPLSKNMSASSRSISPSSLAVEHSSSDESYPWIRDDDISSKDYSEDKDDNITISEEELPHIFQSEEEFVSALNVLPECVGEDEETSVWLEASRSRQTEVRPGLLGELEKHYKSGRSSSLPRTPLYTPIETSNQKTRGSLSSSLPGTSSPNTIVTKNALSPEANSLMTCDANSPAPVLQHTLHHPPSSTSRQTPREMSPLRVSHRAAVPGPSKPNLHSPTLPGISKSSHMRPSYSPSLLVSGSRGLGRKNGLIIQDSRVSTKYKNLLLEQTNILRDPDGRDRVVSVGSVKSLQKDSSTATANTTSVPHSSD